MTASIREQVLQAVLALVTAALPGVTVVRDVDADQDREPSPAGDAVIGDGDPGDPTRDLGVQRYYYDHQIPVDIEVGDQEGVTRVEAMDAYLLALGGAISADRTLGGLVDYLDASAPAPLDSRLNGAESLRQVTIDLIASYWSPTPLG